MVDCSGLDRDKTNEDGEEVKHRYRIANRASLELATVQPKPMNQCGWVSLGKRACVDFAYCHYY